jgi:Bacterial extracellular solute-binding proteins, family 3
MARPKRIRSENTASQSKFVQVVEGYLAKANWTKQELMASLKVGEAQFYRWARGENIPTRTIVNRIAVLIARRIDEVEQDLPHNPFPASDEIDRIVNEFLEVAGYSVSVRGREADVSWNEIARNQAWTLGYTKVPRWLEPPERPGGKPTGLAVKYTEQIGQLLGLKTVWKYLTYDEMPAAIRGREVDGIAPLMLVLPGRFFDFCFSEQCGLDIFKLSALVAPKYTSSATYFEDLFSESVKLLYVKGELGNWGANVLSEVDQPKEEYEDSDNAISALLASIERNEESIAVFLVDNLTGEVLCDKAKKQNDSKPQKWLQLIKIRDINLETYAAFAFHPDEDKLLQAVNSAISMIPKIPSLRQLLKA